MEPTLLTHYRSLWPTEHETLVSFLFPVIFL